MRIPKRWKSRTNAPWSEHLLEMWGINGLSKDVRLLNKRTFERILVEKLFPTGEGYCGDIEVRRGIDGTVAAAIMAGDYWTIYDTERVNE